MRARNAVFVAIEVGQGDAFFMRRGDKTLLVDGGGCLRFPRRFVKATGRNHVNILVCTHNDSDHAKGVLGFLKRGLKADEVWLPASWMDRLEDLVLNPRDFFEELIRDIEESSDVQATLLSHIDGRYAELADKESMVVQANSDVLYETLEKTYLENSRVHYWIGLSRSVRTRELLLKALSGANLIREITIAACHAGSPIKWFDYIGNRPMHAFGGLSDLLVPVNAVEVARIKRPRRSALRYVLLTIQNEQSLVFMSPNDEEKPGALFTADSDLSFYQQIQWHDRMIITSPHHGSEANKKAYVRFSNEARGIEDVVWVRSDRKSNSRPGKSYVTSSGRKYCTWCRHSKLPKQDVRLELAHNAWRSVGTQKCQCC